MKRLPVFDQPITVKRAQREKTNRQGKTSLKSMVLNAKEFATEDGSLDKDFRWIELGVVDLVPGAYFWFTHGHNPALEAICVDRVVLIGAEKIAIGKAS